MGGRGGAPLCLPIDPHGTGLKGAGPELIYRSKNLLWGTAFSSYTFGFICNRVFRHYYFGRLVFGALSSTLGAVIVAPGASSGAVLLAAAQGKC